MNVIVNAIKNILKNMEIITYYINLKLYVKFLVE